MVKGATCGVGRVILKLEEFERAASEKDGGSGKRGGGGGGGIVFFCILSCFGPQHSCFFMEETMQSVMFLV